MVDDFVAAFAGCRPQLLVDAAAAIPRFDRPVLLIWGDSCEFFPMTDAQRLASEFPRATLVSVPGAKTWVPVDNPGAVVDAIVNFVPTPTSSTPAREPGHDRHPVTRRPAGASACRLGGLGLAA